MDWIPLDRYREKHDLSSAQNAVAHAMAAGLMVGAPLAAPAQYEKLSEPAALAMAERTPERLHVQARCTAYVVFLADTKAWQVHLDLLGEFIPFPQRFSNVEAAADAVRREAEKRGYRVVAEHHGRLSRTLDLSPCA